MRDGSIKKHNATTNETIPLETHIQSPPQIDMIDQNPPLEQPLHEALKTCEKNINPVYHEADRNAVRHQKIHHRLTVIASVCGTIAVLFAIIQLSGLFRTSWPLWIEIGAALCALVAVVIGIVQARHPKWLLERCKAERCRMLKFQFLINPTTWSRKNPQTANWEVYLRQEIDTIKSFTRASLKHWVEHDEVRTPPSTTNCVLEKKELQPLLDYYKTRRINVQRDFFFKRSQRFEKLNRYIGQIPPVCFFASVFAALMHFVIDIIFQAQPFAHTASVIFIALAAFLPMLGATFRTFSSANEFARSASLYRARYAVLQSLDERLQKTENKKVILRTLWNIEQLLESEHREWLRLMLQAEWFL